MKLLVAAWQDEIEAYQTTWTEFGKQFNVSGFNIYIARGMKEYISQITSDVTPVSVSVTGDSPIEVWVWT
jgi:phage tail tape-measure protein